MPSAQYCWQDPGGHRVGPVPESYVVALLHQGVLPPGTPLQSPEGAACGLAGELGGGPAVSAVASFDPAVDDVWDDEDEASEASESADASPPAVDAASPMTGAYDPAEDVWADEPSGSWSEEVPEGFDGAWVDADVLAEAEAEPAPGTSERSAQKVKHALDLVCRHRFSDAQEFVAQHLAELRHEADALTILAYARFRLASEPEAKEAQLALVEEQLTEDPSHFLARAFAARMHLALANKQEAMAQYTVCERLAVAGKGDLTVFAELRTCFSAARASEARRAEAARRVVIEHTLPRRGLSLALALASVLMLLAAIYGVVQEGYSVGSLWIGIVGAVIGLALAWKASHPADSVRRR